MPRDRDPLPPAPTGNIFYLKFTTRWNGNDDLIIVKISQKSTFLPGYIALFYDLNDGRGRVPEGALKIRTVDNGEDRFTPIKAKEAVIQFFAESFSLRTFTVGESDEWLVNIYVNSEADANIIFTGFLVLDTASEPMDPKPYNVTLTATDNLGLLKDITLADFAGNNPKNENRIIQYIAWALGKTNLQLPIYVNNNLMEEGAPGVPFYQSCFLHAKSFEKEIGTSVDCSTVLTEILGNDSRIEQISGAWWIERVYERNSNASYVHKFNYDGTFIESEPAAFYGQTIDLRGQVDLINDNANVTIQSPFKSVALSYNYEYPREIIDNIDFSRGDLFTPLDMSPITVGGESFYVSKFHIADWTALEVPTGVIGGTPAPSTTNNYIEKLYFDTTKTFEKERFVVIEKKSPAKGFYIQSNKFPVLKKDKFNISVDVRWSSDAPFPSSGDYRIQVMQVRLFGNGGTNYMLCGGYQIGTDNYQVPFWKVAGPSFSGVENFYIQGSNSENMADWKTCSFITKSSQSSHPCPPIPDSGTLEIILIHNQFADAVDINFNNLTFEYIPFINGGYGNFKGQKSTVSQNGNYSRTLTNPIYISDAPNPLMKGSILVPSGPGYTIAGRFYDGQAFHSGLPADEFLHPFTYQLVLSMWQFYFRYMTSIDTDFAGLKPFSPQTFADLHKIYWFTNPNPNVDNKVFIILHFEQDIDSQIWRAFLAETWDSTIPYNQGDNFQFQYLS